MQVEKKQEKIKLSELTCLSNFIGSMLKYFVKDDISKRKQLASALKESAEGYPEDSGLALYIQLLEDENLTDEKVRYEASELILYDRFLESKEYFEARIMVDVFKKMGLDKEWMLTVEQDTFAGDNPPCLALYCVKK